MSDCTQRIKKINPEEANRLLKEGRKLRQEMMDTKNYYGPALPDNDDPKTAKRDLRAYKALVRELDSEIEKKDQELARVLALLHEEESRAKRLEDDYANACGPGGVAWVPMRNALMKIGTALGIYNDYMSSVPTVEDIVARILKITSGTNIGGIEQAAHKLWLHSKGDHQAINPRENRAAYEAYHELVREVRKAYPNDQATIDMQDAIKEAEEKFERDYNSELDESRKNYLLAGRGDDE